MKFWDLIRTANANLWHNKLRTILTIVAIFVGGFVITLMAGVNTGVNDYINKQLGALGGKDLLMVAKKSTQATNANDKNAGPAKYDPDTASTPMAGVSASLMNKKDLAKINSTKNIEKVIPNLAIYSEWVANAKPGSQKYVISVSQIAPGLTPNLAAGKLPDDNASDNQIAILTSDVHALGFSSNDDALGQELIIGVKNPTNQQIETVSAKIVGVNNVNLITGGDIANEHTFVDMAKISEAGFPDDMKGRVTGALAVMKSDLSSTEVDRIKSSLTKDGFAALTVADLAGTIQDVVNAVSVALIGFGAIALLAASFGIINTLFMSVQERTKEIGLMKAMGMSRAKVFLLFAFEAILIGFWGSLISVLAAIGVGNVINQIAATTFLKNLEGFTLLQFNFVSVASVMLIVMLIAFLAGTLPARRASRKDPIEALRYE